MRCPHPSLKIWPDSQIKMCGAPLNSQLSDQFSCQSSSTCILECGPPSWGCFCNLIKTHESFKGETPLNCLTKGNFSGWLSIYSQKYSPLTIGYNNNMKECSVVCHQNEAKSKTSKNTRMTISFINKICEFEFSTPPPAPSPWENEVIGCHRFLTHN